MALEPLSGVRGEPVGTIAGEKFDHKAWTEGLKRAGLPESTPPPTYSLDQKTAAQLIYPGQKQIVQTVMSGLEQGDGVAIVTPAGSGKTFTSSAVIKEFLKNKPDARILVISKNRELAQEDKESCLQTRSDLMWIWTLQKDSLEFTERATWACLTTKPTRTRSGIWL